jgi:hypothetical protein
MSPGLTFLFSRHTVCVRCGTSRVQRLSRRDSVDSTSRHPFSALMRLFGAPLNRCQACRLQFYDWRPIRHEQK